MEQLITVENLHKSYGSKVVLDVPGELAGEIMRAHAVTQLMTKTKKKSRNGQAETLARSPMRRCPTKTMMRIDVRNTSCASQYMPR